MPKQVFYITGMTCSGCEQSVIKSIVELAGVTKATANHRTGQLSIQANPAISIKDLIASLPKKYAVEDQTLAAPSKARQLFPLFLIFGFIIGATFFIHLETMNLGEMMLDLMALFFMVFSFFKLLDLRGFQSSFKQYDPLASALPFYGWIYPFIELGLGISLIRDYAPNWILILILVILGVTTVGVVRVLLQKKTMQCACLGSVLKLPMTEATFIENAIMLVMAGSMLL